jgi:hypothetical protein
MKPELRAILLAAPALTAKVSSRIDWNWRVSGSPLPAVTLSIPSRAAEYTLDGVGPIEVRFTVDCWAKTTKDVEEMRDIVFSRLDSYTDAFFQGIFFAGDRDLSETDSVTTVHRVSMDFTTTYIFNG